MNDNEILARWQGWELDYKGKLCLLIPACGVLYDVPDYLNDPAACMSLLDTAANKGYKVQLVSNLQCEFVTWDCFITYAPKQTTQGSMDIQTINEAIIAACLEVARRKLETTNSSEAEAALNRKEAA